MREWVERLEAGGCVVVSIGVKERGRYGDLLEWADRRGSYVYIGRHVRYAEGRNQYMRRPYDWGNPYPLNKSTTRDVSLTRFEHEYLPAHPELTARLPELRGKVLGCWCAPQPCHGDVLARLAHAE